MKKDGCRGPLSQSVECHKSEGLLLPHIVGDLQSAISARKQVCDRYGAGSTVVRGGYHTLLDGRRSQSYAEDAVVFSGVSRGCAVKCAYIISIDQSALKQPWCPVLEAYAMLIFYSFPTLHVNPPSYFLFLGTAAKVLAKIVRVWMHGPFQTRDRAQATCGYRHPSPRKLPASDTVGIWDCLLLTSRPAR